MIPASPCVFGIPDALDFVHGDMEMLESLGVTNSLTKFRDGPKFFSNPFPQAGSETAPSQEMLSTSAGVAPQEKTSQGEEGEGKEALICSFRMAELKSQPLRNCLRNVAEENWRVPCLGWLICCWFLWSV